MQTGQPGPGTNSTLPGNDGPKTGDGNRTLMAAANIHDPHRLVGGETLQRFEPVCSAIGHQSAPTTASRERSATSCARSQSSQASIPSPLRADTIMNGAVLARFRRQSSA